MNIYTYNPKKARQLAFKQNLARKTKVAVKNLLAAGLFASFFYLALVGSWVVFGN